MRNGLRIFGARTHGNVIALEFAVKRGAADAKHAAGEGLVSVGLLKNF